MRPWGTGFGGRFDRHVITSGALSGNPLGDPAERPLYVYVPPGIEAGPARHPCIYVIQGMTGQVDMWWNRLAFRSTVPERVDALFADPNVPRALVVFVDAWTSIGGSQYLNSPGTGRYSITSVTRWSPSSMRATRPWPTVTTAGWRASRAAATGRWWCRCCDPTSSAPSPPIRGHGAGATRPV